MPSKGKRKCSGFGSTKLRKQYTMNPEITRIIEQYLSGELSQEDRIQFEHRLATNEELKRELALQQSIQEAARRSFVRSEIEQVGNQYHFRNNLKWGGLGAGILLLLISGVLLLRSNHVKDSFNLDEVKELTEELENNGPIENLKSEFFAWYSNDTAFLSQEGVLVSVPKNVFLLDGKPYTDPAVIQWQEALDGTTIVKAGLSTVSDGRLLETQGMFSFTAKTTDGKQLTINPEVGVYVQVPVDEYKEGMQLFDGEKGENGIINWVKPRQLEKIPIPIDMSKLDFYPPEYEAKLNELKVRKDKKYRDSLYLSFEGLQEDIKITNQPESPLREGVFPLFEIPKRKITSEEAKIIYGREEPVDRMMVFSEAFILRHKNQNVATDLRDFPAHFFITDKNGRNYLYQKSQLSPLLREYLQSNSFEIEKWDSRRTIPVPQNVPQKMNVIPPSNVLSFWNAKFNNTLLATHEFELRMREIHKLCEKSILDLYVSNLDKPMFEIDQMVVDMGHAQFKKFVKECVGSVNPNNPHLSSLRTFYNNGIEALKADVKRLRNAEREKRSKWDEELKVEREKEIQRTVERNANVFNEEKNLNHRNVRKQLGRVVGFRVYGASPISNIDAYVMETTQLRKSAELKDPLTGKILKIQYKEFTFEVANGNEYRKVYAYVFPDKLNSYHRLEGKDGKYSFPLNDEIKYDLAIVGISTKGYSYVQRLTVKGGNLGVLVLDDISENKLDQNIRKLNAKRGVKAFDVKEELRWIQKEQKNYVEQKRRTDEMTFRNELRPKVYPCDCSIEQGDTIESNIDLPPIRQK
jgi:hypothetical protein